MKRSRLFLIVLTLLLNVSQCYAFTFDGDFNYQTPSLGVVHFGRDFTATIWDTWNTLTRWQTLVWNTHNRGVFAIDVSNGCTINVTSMQAQALIYDVVAAGAETQEIYYQGLGRPGSVVGGTFVMNGDNTVVTTNGNTTVTITWNQEALNEVRGNLTSYLGIWGLVPLIMVVATIMGALSGYLSVEDAIKIIAAVVGVLLMTVILGVFVKI